MTRTRAWRRVALTALLSLVAVGCSQAPAGVERTAAGDTTVTTGSGAPSPSPGCGADPTPAVTRGVQERVDLVSGGADRWYERFVPSSEAGAPAPLVIDLHGYLSGATGQVSMSELERVAAREGFVLVTPQGNSDKPYWNAVPHAELPDDVGFIADLIDHVGQDLCIDTGRVYVDGFSNGAFLTSLIACRLADRVAAVAAVSGLQVPASCAPTRPVPVLAVHGTADGFVSFTGGPNPRLATLEWNDESRAAFAGLPFADVTGSAARWAELDGCGPAPTRTAVSAHVELVSYSGCQGGTAVELYVVDGGGHSWPGSSFAAASASILGPATDEIDASDLIWQFFREQRRS